MIHRIFNSRTQQSLYMTEQEAKDRLFKQVKEYGENDKEETYTSLFLCGMTEGELSRIAYELEGVSNEVCLMCIDELDRRFPKVQYLKPGTKFVNFSDRSFIVLSMVNASYLNIIDGCVPCMNLETFEVWMHQGTIRVKELVK